MIDQIFATYYVFAVGVTAGTWMYGSPYGGERDWVFDIAGGVIVTAVILALIHTIHYIWR
jgi:hypothetical protein